MIEQIQSLPYTLPENIKLYALASLTTSLILFYQDRQAYNFVDGYARRKSLKLTEAQVRSIYNQQKRITAVICAPVSGALTAVTIDFATQINLAAVLFGIAALTAYTMAVFSRLNTLRRAKLYVDNQVSQPV